MFFSQPALYLKTPAFQLKLALLVLAGINMAVFHLWTHRNIAAWDSDRRTPIAAKVAGLVSLSVWIGVMFAGRFVGFTLSAF
jgi:hypothetical protein